MADTNHLQQDLQALLKTTTSNLALMLQKVDDYHAKPLVARFAVETEIKLLTAMYAGNIQRMQSVDIWLASDVLASAQAANARLALTQLALTQSVIQQSLELLRERVPTAPDVPRIEPVMQPISRLQDFIGHLEHDKILELRTYGELDALAQLNTPRITDLDIAKMEDNTEHSRSIIDAAQKQVAHWHTQHLNPSQQVLLEVARQAIQDHVALVNDISELIVQLKPKTVEARKAAADAGMLAAEQKN